MSDRRERYYFVYRCHDPVEIDFRCPIGGVMVVASTDLAAIGDAWVKARSRYVCKPREVLMLVEQGGAEERRQVLMLERDWERAFTEFRELMEVS